MVSERQKERGKKENNEGAWHFHMVCFISQKIDFNKLKDCWQYGSVDIKLIDDVKIISRYIVKYITKDMLDCNLNDKLIYTSQGLKRPVEKRSMTIEEIPSTMEKRYCTQYAVKNEYSPEQIICYVSEYEKK